MSKQAPFLSPLIQYDTRPLPQEDSLAILYGLPPWNPPPWMAPPNGPPGVECLECGDIIKEGEKVIEMFCGVVGRSWRTGKASVVNDLSLEFEPIHLHLECVSMYAFSEIPGNDYQWELDDPLCPSCGEKVFGDHGEEEDNGYNRKQHR